MNELNGKKILVTRAKDADPSFENTLTSLGASVINFPVIEIKPVESFAELDKKISELSSYDGIFFTSSNAVKYFFERLKRKEAKFSGKIYTVGSKTKSSVESYGYKVYFTSSVYSAEALSGSINIEEVRGKKFLFPRGNLSRDMLIQKLSAIADIDDVIVYETIMPESDTAHVKRIDTMLRSGEIDCISFFSPSAVENFLKIFPEFKQDNTKMAAIGGTTSEVVNKLGLRTDITPDVSTAENLADAITKYFIKHKMNSPLSL